jgi:hypothetical protein
MDMHENLDSLLPTLTDMIDGATQVSQTLILTLVPSPDATVRYIVPHASFHHAACQIGHFNSPGPKHLPVLVTAIAIGMRCSGLLIDFRLYDQAFHLDWFCT